MQQNFLLHWKSFSLDIRNLILFSCFFLSLASCSSPQEEYVGDLETLVSHVKSDFNKVSGDEWKEYDQQFEELSNQMELYRDEMTEDERTKANVMIGKYKALQLKRKANHYLDDLKDAVDQAKTVITEVAKDTTIIKKIKSNF